MRLVAWDRVWLVGRERGYAFVVAVAVRIAAKNTELQAVEVVTAGSGHAATETLVRAREETRVTVRAIEQRLARHAPIDAHARLASKAVDTVGGVVTARLDSKATTDDRIACIGRICALEIVLASATANHETSGEVLASGGHARFAHGTWVFFVAEGLEVGARGTKRRGFAPRAAPVW